MFGENGHINLYIISLFLSSNYFEASGIYALYMI